MKKSKKKIASLIATTSLLVIVITGMAYAWFTFETVYDISEINLSVIECNNLEIGFDLNNLSHSLGVKYELSGFKQVSGDGVNFYDYKSDYDEEKDGVASLLITGYRKLTNDQMNESFFRTDFVIKTENTKQLYFSKTSYLIPNDVSKRLNKGISRDYIAGAMRLAISEKTDDGEVPVIVWAPNSSVEAKLTESGTVLNPAGFVESTYSIICGTELNDYVSIPTNSYKSGIFKVEYENENRGPDFIWGDLEDDIDLGLINPGERSFVLSLWLEGTDRECIKHFAGGQIELGVNFTAKDVE